MLDEVLSSIEVLKRRPFINQHNIDKITSELRNIFIASAGMTFRNRNQASKKLQNTNKPWFNKTCRTARSKFYLAKRLNSKGKTPETLCNLKHNSKEYKKAMGKCIKDYNKSISDKLKTLHKGQPKEKQT